MPRPSLASLPILALFLLAVPLGAVEEGEAPKAQVSVDTWLVLGPAPLALPVFAGEEGEDGGKVEAKDLLAAVHLPLETVAPTAAWPAEGGAAALEGAGAAAWRRATGAVELEYHGGGPALAYLAAYVTTERFIEAELTVSSSQRLRVWVDGQQVADKTDASKKGEAGKATATVALPTGKHLVLVKALADAEGPAGWTVAAELAVAEDRRGAVALDADPAHGLGIADLLDVDQVTGLAVSPGGDLVAVELENPTVPADHQERWVEVRRTGDGEVVRAFRGAPRVESFAWGPDGRYSYVTRDGGKATLWVGRWEGGTVTALLEGVERFGGYAWSPRGDSLVYTVSTEAKPDERGAQRLRSLEDRWAGFREIGHLYQVAVEGGARRRLTAGPRSTDLQDIAPDGRRLLFTRTRYTRERPFSVGELYELTLGAALEIRKVVEVPWLNQAQYGPDGEQVLLTAGPSAFGRLGMALPEGLTPNEYEGELYLVDRSDGEPRPLTRDFDPAVDEARWARSGALVLRVTEGERSRLYTGEPAVGFTPLETGVDVVSTVSVAEEAPAVVYLGSSPTAPPRVLATATTGGAPRQLFQPAAATYERVRFGRVEDFDFTAEDGTVIPGRLHYPPDFDSDRKYPLLVYYYGGVVPTERDFGGRYPKNFWTANGYVVYVLQPSGAVGWGQERAARHVNDWGLRTAAEILRGVEALLAAKPFLDRGRIGCFGGSYGGFTTMRLITESKLFAAAISHAGISAIPSYWGEGWWGYLYSAVASADSYPWNRPDLYVDHSPLFAADRIETPLLLLHGTADPNVPPGESDQMFVALRLLGKEVEYVRFAGEQHWILSYPKRKLWWETIIAWFDKHLKDEPEYWEHLWKGKG
jgi:dipeptidyl aminopeptidase/acylaminoacyl peptidase